MSFTKVAPAGIGTEPGTAIRLGDSLLHSTGLDIGVGSGIGVTIRQHGDATFTGIITASAFFGDGSGLEGVSSSGIGTPLSDDDTSTLNKAYYVNQELSIGSTVTVNHPSSAVASYTHYQDIVVTDDADFIVADGDTFIPDVLGINTSTLPNAVSSATGGRIRAGTITNAGANGAVNFPNGLVATSATFTGVLTYEDVTNVDSIGIITARGGIRIGGGTTVGPSSGIITYFGDGSQLTGISADSTKIETGNTKVETVDTGSDGHVKITTEGSERLRIISTGLMGVGTQSPQKNLHLYSSGVATLRIETGDSRGQAWDILSTNGAQNNTGTLSFRDESGSAYLEFGANGGSPELTVRNGGANDLLHIDNNGNVNKPRNAFAIIYTSSGDAGVSNNKIKDAYAIFTGIHLNQGSHYSTSTGRFTCPVDGVYGIAFASNLNMSNMSVGNNFNIQTRKNGSIMLYNYDTVFTQGWQYMSFTNYVNCNANDWLAIYYGGSAVFGADQGSAQWGELYFWLVQ